MKRLFRAVVAAAAACGAMAQAGDEPGFEPIFDGHSLAGWQGQDMSFWSVEDDAITGTITADHAPAMNQYLVYQGKPVEDFELKLDFRLTGSTTPDTNGGFQFRSRRLPDGDVAGYQVDNNFAQPWKVRLYDEFGRHDLALEGQRSYYDRRGRRAVEPLELPAGALDFRLDQWHEYHLVADGPNLTLSVNGRMVAACTDDDLHQSEPLGVLAVQLHTGPPMKAQFKNLRLKRLPMARPLTPRQHVMSTAALDWRLGRRPGTHQPPLAISGEVTAESGARGEGARADGVARLEHAYFDAGPQWGAVGNALSVYLRARAPDGNWSQALFSKGAGAEGVNFNLFGDDLPGQPGSDIACEIRTDRGVFRAAFPVSEIDPLAWHDLFGRYNGKTLEVLCDGKLMASVAAEGQLVSNQAPLLIGAESDGQKIVRCFTGEIEQASLWTRALDDDELLLVRRADSASLADAPHALAAGDHARTLVVDGRQRSYLLHVPPGYDPAAATPVVLVFHGAGLNARLMMPFCNLNQKADEAGFVAVYPNGTGRANLYLTFNAGGVPAERARQRPDDVRFVSALLDDLARVVRVDAKRVFATGVSNGGMMCYRLAAELPERIAAIAPVAASVAGNLTPKRPVSILHFHGTADTFVPLSGPGEETPESLDFKSIDEAMRLWTQVNGCSATSTAQELPDVEDDGTRVTRKTFGPGKGGAEVVLYLIEGGGHTWPGQKPPLPLMGKSTLDISANDLIWDFFQRHPLAD